MSGRHMSFDDSARPNKKRKFENSPQPSQLGGSEAPAESRSDDREELEREQRHHQESFRHRMEDIFQRYSVDLADEADEINIRTGAIVVDRGHWRTLPDADYDDDCDSFTSEEDGILDDHDEDILDFLKAPASKAPAWLEDSQDSCRAETPAVWQPTTDIKPLICLEKDDLPSDATILRQFGSAGPAVIEVLKRQASERASTPLPETPPRKPETFVADCEELDDLSMLASPPCSMTPIKVLHTPRVLAISARPYEYRPSPLSDYNATQGSRHKTRPRPVSTSSIVTPSIDKPSSSLVTSPDQSVRETSEAVESNSIHPPAGTKLGKNKILLPSSDVQSSRVRVKIRRSDVNEKTYKCGGCGTIFATSACLLGHHDQGKCERKDKVFLCPAGCEKVFYSPYHLRKHVDRNCPHKSLGSTSTRHSKSSDIEHDSLLDTNVYSDKENIESAHRVGDLDPMELLRSPMFTARKSTSSGRFCSHLGSDKPRKRLKICIVKRPCNGTFTRPATSQSSSDWDQDVRAGPYTRHPWDKFAEYDTSVDQPVPHPASSVTSEYTARNWEAYMSPTKLKSALRADPEDYSDDDLSLEVKAVAGWRKVASRVKTKWVDPTGSVSSSRIKSGYPEASCLSGAIDSTDERIDVPTHESTEASQKSKRFPEATLQLLRPRRVRTLSEKGRSTAFEELITLQDQGLDDIVQNASNHGGRWDHEVVDSEAEWSATFGSSSQSGFDPKFNPEAVSLGCSSETLHKTQSAKDGRWRLVYTRPPGSWS